MQIVYDYAIILFVWSLFVALEYPRSVIIPLIRQRYKVAYKEDRLSVWMLFVPEIIVWIIFETALIMGVGMLPAQFMYLGFALVVAGLALRQWAISALGLFWASTVRILKQHKVVNSGPYKYVRHPSYTGAFIFYIGLGFIARSPILIVLTLAVLAPAFAYRIRVEEASLAKHVAGYSEYARSRKRIIPRLL
jgi:protein-S-isoprenylcysteine O-methyltransferase Ste14